MFVIGWAVTAIFLSAQSYAAETSAVSIESLLQEMVDRDSIAQLPEPAYTCKQFSSHSRKANDPTNLETWFHNEDWSNFVRVDELNGQDEYVLLECDGPGAIVRWWNTVGDPGLHEGTIRIYLDGKSKPVVECKNKELLGGNKLVGEPLSFGVQLLVIEL